MQQVIPVKTTNQSLSSGITPLARHKRWIVKDADIKKSTKNVNTSSFEDEDVMHLAENDLVNPIPNSTKFVWLQGSTDFARKGHKKMLIEDFSDGCSEQTLSRTTKKINIRSKMVYSSISFLETLKPQLSIMYARTKTNLKSSITSQRKKSK